MEKIKLFINNCLKSEKGKDILVVLIVILVGLGCFELGRLSKENSSSPGLKILPADETGEYPNEDQSANIVSASIALKAPLDQTNSKAKNFFASNRGSKYYSLGCAGGKSIILENRIYFATKEEAERAGYQLSSSCQ